MDAAEDDIARRRFLREKADDLALGKDGAHTVDGHRLRARDEFVDLCNVAADARHRHFQEAARTGRTFVVHQKIADLPRFIEQDDLAVLTADIDDRIAAGTKERRARAVAGDLGDDLVRLGQQLASVTGRDDKGSVLRLHFFI